MKLRRHYNYAGAKTAAVGKTADGQYKGRCIITVIKADSFIYLSSVPSASST